MRRVTTETLTGENKNKDFQLTSGESRGAAPSPVTDQSYERDERARERGSASGNACLTRAMGQSHSQIANEPPQNAGLVGPPQKRATRRGEKGVGKGASPRRSVGGGGLP